MVKPRRRHTIKDARAQRAAKAAALSDLAGGRIQVTEALSAPPVALHAVDIYDVLLRCPTLGREGVRVVLERAAVWPHTPLGELAEAQRTAIILALPPRLQLAA